MIRSTWAFDTKVLDDLSEFAADFTRIASDVGERAFGRIHDDLLDELRYYPPPPANSSYARTGRLRDGWIVGFERRTDGFAIKSENDTSYTKYVVGSFAKSLAAAAAFQALVHQGRWVLASQTIAFWYDALVEVYQDEFQKECLSRFGSTLVSRRAFTR